MKLTPKQKSKLRKDAEKRYNNLINSGYNPYNYFNHKLIYNNYINNTASYFLDRYMRFYSYLNLKQGG